jgi:hypothetical protein
MSGLSGSQAAATLATTLVGAKLGLFDELTINAVLVVILLVASAGLMTTLVSGVTATRLDEARTRAAQIAAQQIEDLRTVKWSQLGVYADESGYTNFHNGESVVTLGRSSRPTPPVDLPKIHILPLNVQGRKLQRGHLDHGWALRPRARTDGTTYAQKRLSVDVTYTIERKRSPTTPRGFGRRRRWRCFPAATSASIAMSNTQARRRRRSQRPDADPGHPAAD